LLHLWSQQFNLTRRVLGITDHSTERLAFAVQHFGRAKPDRLEFLRVDFERSVMRQSFLPAAPRNSARCYRNVLAKKRSCKVFRNPANGK
jgi:hypothetical protein